MPQEPSQRTIPPFLYVYVRLPPSPASANKCGASAELEAAAIDCYTPVMDDKAEKNKGWKDGNKDSPEVLRSSLFEPTSVAQMQGEYRISQPYRHLVIPDLMDREVLKTACEELKRNMQATLKETDIFKVGCW